MRKILFKCVVPRPYRCSFPLFLCTYSTKIFSFYVTASPPSPARYAPKWTVPSYMFDGAEYPQMVSGAGYLATAPAAECIYRSVFAYPYFHLEDVLLTGAKGLGGHTAHTLKPLMVVSS